MSGATLRNYNWVYTHAKDIASRKRGIMRGMVTVGEIVQALGFSAATVRKYLSMLETEGHVYLAVDTKSVKIWRVKDLS